MKCQEVNFSTGVAMEQQVLCHVGGDIFGKQVNGAWKTST